MSWPSSKSWVVEFGPVDGQRPKNNCLSTGADTRAHQLYWLDQPSWPLSVVSESTDCCVLFDGFLYNRAELIQALQGTSQLDDARLVLLAYRYWGDTVLSRIKGIFTLLIRDHAREILICARDPVGVRPLFYVEDQDRLILSPSIDSLLPYTSGEINRPALVDYLCRQWTGIEETCFQRIHRILPGHVFTIARSDRTIRRYWDPTGPSAQIEDDNVEGRFQKLLAQAVSRGLDRGRAAVYLSGGLDSAAITTLTSDACEMRNLESPRAFSVDFPGLYSEIKVQDGVVRGLGISHTVTNFNSTVAPEGILLAGMALSQELPTPLMFEPFAPLFLDLSRKAGVAGYEVMLSGEGGDEWLGTSPALALYFLQRGNSLALFRLWRMFKNYYPDVRWSSAVNLIWKYGLKAMLRQSWQSSKLRGTILARNHAISWSPPESWIAPDPDLRRQMAGRRKPSFIDSKSLQLLDGPQSVFRVEQTHLFARNSGVAQVDPFWDADLIDFVLKIRPERLYKGGRSKALIRESLDQRYPALGFDRQIKQIQVGLLRERIVSEAPAAVRAMGSKWVLAELGLVDQKNLNYFLTNFQPRQAVRVMDVMNLEAWVRSHV